MADGRRRIAILGGGVAGLTAAYELTNPAQPNPPEVTLYQLGWRLGGKCASGRNQAIGCRVQEHGLHVFFGFYDNTFAMLRDCYEELKLPAGERFRSIWDALEPYNEITVMEAVRGRQVPWVIPAPPMSGRPGDPNPPSVWSAVATVIEWLLGLQHRLVVSLIAEQVSADLSVCKDLLEKAASKAGPPSASADAQGPDDHRDIARLVNAAAAELGKRLGPATKLGDKLRRLMILFDFAATNAAGALADGVVLNPYDGARRLNGMDYRDWMNRHSILHLAENSAVLRALYDLIFAYPGGDVTKRGDVAAGAMLLALVQLALYRGSILWKMRAGTGDIVAAPLYKLLRKRGVRFEFFSRVDELTPSSDGNTIDGVTIGRQVTFTSGAYQPLIRCQNLDCWPAEPLYDQLVQGQELKDQHINLESPWNGWSDAGGTLELQRGRDFDDVVLAISVAALPTICAKLIANDSRWRRMTEQVATVETMNVQLWFDRTLAEMGWTEKPGTVLGGYDVSQLDTWADISEVLDSECWGAGAPKNASILVGPMKGPDRPPPPSDRGYPAQAQQAVVNEAQTFLENYSAALWPSLTKVGFDWSSLHAPANLQGPQRLGAQYLRPNIAPSERYVLSRTGTIEARLRADASGYQNLALAGDWVDNPQNLGSFEASVMSGMLASRALTRLPGEILRVNSNLPLMKPPPGWPPPFVDHVGMQTFPGRIDFEGVKLTYYFLKADHARLTSICRAVFNEPSGGAVSCVPLSNWIAMSFGDMGRGRFSLRPDMGWSNEKELAFWMLVGRLKSPNSSEIDDVFFYNPYLCIDNPVAMLTGREVYGFHKQAGWVDLPPDGSPSPVFSAEAFGTAESGPDAEWKRLPLLKLEGSKPLESPADLPDLDAVMARLAKEMPADALLYPGWPALLEFARAVAGGWVPVAFLKQFRDIENGALACFQAICSAQAQMTRFRKARLMLPGNLTVYPLVSLPIAKHLGIPANGATGIGVELSIDMSLHPGGELWRANPQ
jgi:uncharacterized protein with NAD-binding domain and iron-sulfur cluster